jgi:hypothetical protein
VTKPKGEFTLSNGRTVALISLRQWAVYAGLLEGLPTRERNDAEVSALVKEARAADGREPVLIPPTQRPIEHEGRYPFGEPASLPRIGCIARFHSFQPARDPKMDVSDLTVIWFQDDYAFPMSDEAESAILALDWGSVATDGEW